MNAYAYIRVSGKGQLMGSGFERQLETIKKCCAAKGYKLKEIFREQISGTTDETDRPEFKALIAALLRNGEAIVIVESLDRLAREYRIQEQLLIYLASKGIDLIAANTGENVTKAIYEDPMRKAMVQMQGIFAELDKSLTVKKLRKARERIRQTKGKCEGRKSYRETTKGKEILYEIRLLRRKPKGKPRMTYRKVAEALNSKGYRAANGQMFSANTVRGLVFRDRHINR